MTDESKPGFWAILELFGHKQIAGFVTEVQLAGAQMVKVDVPAIEEEATLAAQAGANHQYRGHRAQPSFERLYAPSAIYSLTQCTEEQARRFVEYYAPAPEPVYVPPEPLLIPAGVVEAAEVEIDEPGQTVFGGGPPDEPPY